MNKKWIYAVIAVFLSWMVLDFVIHGVILKSSYESTASLWRPNEEMKCGLMFTVVFISAALFVTLYHKLVSPKSVKHGLLCGVLLGLTHGIGMGYGTYAVMPIPYTMALTWFLGSAVEGAAAGFLTGLIIRE